MAVVYGQKAAEIKAYRSAPHSTCPQISPQGGDETTPKLKQDDQLPVSEEEAKRRLGQELAKIMRKDMKRKMDNRIYLRRGFYGAVSLRIHVLLSTGFTEICLSLIIMNLERRERVMMVDA
ncbi:hypothetical protein K449DRAFT_432660 [Hypoxylon sp. EC38]|nr:hypothetical protein K449DRAFT_432660 [Hypoxylon sp. EC38]